jgi:cytochrome c-type biogenesis protein
MEAPSLYLAFAAGLLSFLSPCVLPLIPAYIGYLGGSVVTSARRGGAAAAAAPPNVRLIAFLHSLAFVLGFTLIFVVVVGSLAGVVSELFKTQRQVIQWVMGIMLIVFGLNAMGMVKIPFLDYTRRLDIRPATNLGYLRSFLIGIGFAIGWSPCIGYWLGIIVTLSLSGRPDQAFMPFLAYSIGLGIPFLLAGLAMGQIAGWLKKITRKMYTVRIGNWTVIDHVNIVSLISGIFLVIMGLLIVTNSMAFLAQFGPAIDLAPPEQ